MQIVSSFTLFVLLFSVIFYTPNAKAAPIFEKWTETTWINAWVVDTSGSIYTPVALNTDVNLNYESVYDPISSVVYQVTKKDLIVWAHKGYWNSYPTAQMNIGTLTLRGAARTLPTVGNYLYNSSYNWYGKYSSAVERYATAFTSNTGTSYFNVGSSGTQLNSTSTVTFNW
ncbi:hypothetical protein [Cohnella abietis]|uniref:Uncharacterized protein n=1 Tax=Cohnella abietis TaxID=2507935 RepID=A0A3T1CY36_9BACL|nr:hypothetical protein [Cohnella abietis]BBI30777.1 hypothetical protein KCTCHS21_01760 [Cohnella abietis]